MAEAQADQTQAVTQGNSTEARDATGAIKDQQGTETKSTTELKDNSSTTSTEQLKDKQTTDTAKTGDDKKTDAKAEAGKVPDKYDFKAPEGQKLDDKLIAEATPIFKELGLDNAQASKLVDLYNKVITDSQSAGAKAVETMRGDWRNEVVKSADLGNGTDNLKPEVRANLSKVMDAVGDAKAVSAFKQALDLTGSGDNPAVIRGLNAIGKLLSEGSLVTGGGPSKLGQSAPGAAPKSAASALFPNLPTSSRA